MYRPLSVLPPIPSSAVGIGPFLVLPALVGLLLGFFPLFLPRLVADVVQFPPNDTYLYQLEGAATLGFGIALSIGLFQKEWLVVRFR